MSQAERIPAGNEAFINDVEGETSVDVQGEQVQRATGAALLEGEEGKKLHGDLEQYSNLTFLGVGSSRGVQEGFDYAFNQDGDKENFPKTGMELMDYIDAALATGQPIPDVIVIDDDRLTNSGYLLAGLEQLTDDPMHRDALRNVKVIIRRDTWKNDEMTRRLANEAAERCPHVIGAISDIGEPNELATEIAKILKHGDDRLASQLAEYDKESEQLGLKIEKKDRDEEIRKRARTDKDGTKIQEATDEATEIKKMGTDYVRAQEIRATLSEERKKIEDSSSALKEKLAALQDESKNNTLNKDLQGKLNDLDSKIKDNADRFESLKLAQKRTYISSDEFIGVSDSERSLRKGKSNLQESTYHEKEISSINELLTHGSARIEEIDQILSHPWQETGDRLEEVTKAVDELEDKLPKKTTRGVSPSNY